MMLIIKSLRVEKHLKKIGNNIQDEISYIFNCRSQNKNYELIIHDDGLGENDSIQFLLKEVKMFSGISYVTKEIVEIEFDPNEKQYDNSFFKTDGNRIQIKYDYLISTARKKEKRPVWIMMGKSALGKSYLSSMLVNGSDLTKYETDMSPELPDEICEDLIVVGNKYKFSLKEIKAKIRGEYEPVIITFEQGE